MSGKGKRYSDEEKEKILSYVQQINTELGRGGVARAARKFGVTPLTIHNWLRAADRPASSGVTKSAGLKAIKRLANLHESISELDEEIAKLRKEYSKVKGSL